MEKVNPKKAAAIAVLAALAMQVLTWFVWYPLAGYNDTTLLIAQLAFLALGIVLFLAFKMRWQGIGLGRREFFEAVLKILLAYAAVLLIVVILKAAGSEINLFRQQYNLYAFVNNWLLTGVGEELVFAGVLFNLISISAQSRRRWSAVLLTAMFFALWHLPGYLAVGIKMDSLNAGIAVDLLLNMISWGFFGTIYLFSGNLWLTAFAHASTDYALLPAVVNSPVIGLVFMLITVALAYWPWPGKRRLTMKDNKAAEEFTGLL